jgi:hypothetical protein
MRRVLLLLQPLAIHVVLEWLLHLLRAIYVAIPPVTNEELLSFVAF